MKMALSEIFVVSFADTPLTAEPGVRAMASYYDMLGANAFGSFRVLLEQVTLHPVMGLYLTYLGNVKENPATGQHPDENFAREVLQLMSTGLYLLNPDGTPVTDGAGARIPTFSHADIQGLAKVFTGFSWYAAKPSNATFFKLTLDPDATVRPMIPYPAFHSVSAKSFLGATIPAAAVADPLGDLKIALDTIFHHPNVGPFIGRQLIQRFVTSNPSPAYVSRVAATFADDGTGTRGNLGAVLTAVLMDPEARDDTAVSSPTFGKLREPVLRLANWMRSFGATSVSGNWLVGSTSAPTSLGQTVLTAPSVFNFFSPGYTPPGSSLGRAGLFAPEFQAVNEVSVAGYLNTLQAAVGVGLGLKGAGGKPDVQSAYVNEVALAPQLPSLLDRLNLLLLYGQMSAGLRAQILRALNGTNSALRAVRLAVFIILASPEYVAQR